MNIKRWAREPLVHFLLGGIALFLFFAWKGEPADPASRQIAISQEDRARMSLQWQRTMQRPPTDAELDALTNVWLREEILYREALRLGLDQGDAVVRKRMATKMDFLAASIAESAKPAEETLKQWLADHPQRFAADTAYSFDQRFFADKSDAEAALAKGEVGTGDTIALPKSGDAMSSRQVESKFGMAFLDNLRTLDADGEWAGPMPSGFGWHVVRVTKVAVGEVPPIEDIRARVENDWRLSTMEKRRDDAFQLLRDSYDVTVEK
jgi:hypothetical protein